MTKRTGSGEGLTAHPIFDISPPLPEGSRSIGVTVRLLEPPQESKTVQHTQCGQIYPWSASTSISIGVIGVCDRVFLGSREPSIQQLLQSHSSGIQQYGSQG